MIGKQILAYDGEVARCLQKKLSIGGMIHYEAQSGVAEGQEASFRCVKGPFVGWLEGQCTQYEVLDVAVAFAGGW